MQLTNRTIILVVLFLVIVAIAVVLVARGGRAKSATGGSRAVGGQDPSEADADLAPEGATDEDITMFIVDTP